MKATDTIVCCGREFRPFIGAAQIAARVEAMGAQLTADFAGRNPLLVCVLNGAFVFAADLFRALRCEAEIAFVRLQSYSGTASTGSVRQIIGLTQSVAGRDVIVVEDIIDTGRTMARFLADLSAQGAAQVRLATLLFKPDSLVVPVKPDYVGFAIGSEFIVGYGLDLDGIGRNLPDIYVINN